LKAVKEKLHRVGGTQAFYLFFAARLAISSLQISFARSSPFDWMAMRVKTIARISPGSVGRSPKQREVFVHLHAAALATDQTRLRSALKC